MDLPNEKLAELYEELNFQEEDIVASKIEVRKEILRRMKRESEIWGNYAISKRKNYKPLIGIDKAKELGITKNIESIDTAKFKKLVFSGALKPEDYTLSITPLVRNITGENAE